jgi:hypothetical protein
MSGPTIAATLEVPTHHLERAMIDWTTPDWGKAGSNVHHSSDGSWWDETDERGE